MTSNLKAGDLGLTQQLYERPFSTQAPWARRGGLFPCAGGHPGQGRMPNGIPGLRPLEASSGTAMVAIRNVCRRCQTSLGRHRLFLATRSLGVDFRPDHTASQAAGSSPGRRSSEGGDTYPGYLIGSLNQQILLRFIA